MSDIKEKILELNKKLLNWAKEYYQNDAPSVSDLEYDGAYNQYSELIKLHPELEPEDSILQKVGFEIDNRFKKVEHEFPMLSLSNAFNNDDLLKFNKQIKDQIGGANLTYTLELKIDGASIAIIYENGKLAKAVTRGNGVIGEDVTHNILKVKDIPHTIPYKNKIEFRGEIYMPNKVFDELNAQGANFANPRNAAAGTMRQLDSSVVEKRSLATFIYAIPNPLDHNLKTHTQTLEFIKEQGFQVNPLTKQIDHIDQALPNINEFISQREKLDYEIDGAVLKVNDITTYEDIGYTVKFPKFMIAYKFPEEVASTELLDIFPTIGRTGRVTYNAKLSPVRLAGTTVSAATLHNADYVRERQINVGDVVEVKKAGEIIPRVLGVKTKNNNSEWIESQECPACGHALERKDGEVDQYCFNSECPQQNIAKLEHFVSRNAMDIEGLSIEQIKLFLQEGLITNLASIFDLPNKQMEVLSLQGFKERSVSNLVQAINKSKTQELDKFIFALGIRHIGSKNAKILARRFGSLEKIMTASEEEIMNIRDLGPKASSSLISYFEDQANIDLINKMKEHGLNLKEFDQPTSNHFSGKTFVITGTLSKPRKHYQQIIESKSGNVSGSVSAKTDFVLAGEEAGSKLEKAKKLNVKVIDENEFEQLIKEENHE